MEAVEIIRELLREIEEHNREYGYVTPRALIDRACELADRIERMLETE